MRLQTVSVVKIGGSVLTGRAVYQRVAVYIRDRLRRQSDERVVVVVSAELGTTDALLAAAREIMAEPDPSTLDLLWATGEMRSVALLTLHLQAAGTRAIAANIHQAGLSEPDQREHPAHPSLRPLRLLALLDTHDAVVVPGFLARGAGDRIASLGRGGSDLTAVLLAAGLKAARCELVKDVPGYFTTDPKQDPQACPMPRLTYARAMEMADDGCELVQRQALIAARQCALPLVIRALDGVHETLVGT